MAVAPTSRKAEVTSRPKPPVPPATRTTLLSNLTVIAYLWAYLISNISDSLTITLEPFGHQEAIVIDVASAAIEFEGRIVAGVDLQMNSVDTHFAGRLLD